MKKNIDDAISWIKKQDIRGCITGSCMLGYFENQDIDVFVYDEKSFNKLLFAMYYGDKFLILDKLEQWKFDRQVNAIESNKAPFGINTIKFTYNTCIPVNIIYKKHCYNIFSVLSSFDMDIISLGYDIETKQYLDLSGDSHKTKKASWNKWNTSYYNPDLWEISRILRQLERVIKYHKRGYDTDDVLKKYITLIKEIQQYQNIFNSINFSEKLKVRKKNAKIVKEICEVWLNTHKITDKQLETLTQKIKEI